MTTLRTLRADVMSGYRVRMFASGTVPTGAGTTTTLYDNTRQEPIGDWDKVDTWLLLTSGANDGTIARITGWSAGSTNTLTFAPAATGAVGSGSTYQLFKTFHPTTHLNLAVNSALREMFPERRVQSFATAAEPNGAPTVANTSATMWIPVPSAAANPNSKLLRVERSVGTTNSDWNYEPLFEEKDYHLSVADTGLAGGYQARMEFRYIPVMSYNLRFVYEARAAELAADTDDTPEPEDVILMAARKHLALMEGDDPGVQKWGREAEAAKARHVKITDPAPLVRPIIRVTA